MAWLGRMESSVAGVTLIIRSRNHGANGMNKVIVGLMVGALSMGTMSAHADGNAEAGKKKFYTCEGCHSVPGIQIPIPLSMSRVSGGSMPTILSLRCRLIRTGRENMAA